MIYFSLCPSFPVVQYAVDGLRHPYIWIIFVWHLRILDCSTHFVYIKSNGKEGRVHCVRVFSKMREPLVARVVFDVSEDGGRRCASLPSMFATFLWGKSFTRFLFIFFQPVIDFYGTSW